jgi:endonuclease/exonuclease/phosphatase family metal-dependent hydrolase
MTPIETGSFTSAECTESPTALRIVSWNIARGSKLNAVVEYLASADADLIFLQETDRNARRTHYRNVAREIAEKLRVHYVFGCEFEELGQGSRTSPAYHGQATLSRWPLASGSILRFRGQSRFWRPRWFIPRMGPLQRRLGGRMALFVDMLLPGKSVAAYNLHLESKGHQKICYSQLQELLEDTGRYSPDAPVIAAGDFNFDLSDGQAAAALANFGFRNPFARLRQATSISHTFLGRDHAIDWIVLRGPLDATNPQVHSSVSASDHYPLSLTVRFSEWQAWQASTSRGSNNSINTP